MKTYKKRRYYIRNFVLEGIGKELSEVKNNLKAGFILGNNDFFEWVKETFIQNKEEDEEIPVLRQLKVKVTLEKIEEKVEEEIGDQQLAKKLSIYLSHKYTGQRLKEIAGFFGRMGDTGISQIYNKVEKARGIDKSLDCLIKMHKKA